MYAKIQTKKDKLKEAESEQQQMINEFLRLFENTYGNHVIPFEKALQELVNNLN